MAKLTKASIFTTAQPKTETAMEKTTRAVKEIKDSETKEREDKMVRLRRARHESEAEAPEKPKP